MSSNLQEKKGIQQRIPISIRKISKNELDSLIQSYKQSALREPKKTALVDITYHIKKIKDRDEHLGHVLETINTKLDKLITLISTKIDEDEDLKEETVFLKSDQIIFKYPDRLSPGDLLEIRLRLELNKLICFGEVQRVEPREDFHIIVARLIWVTDDDQDKFVEYLFKQEILADKLKRGLQKD